MGQNAGVSVETDRLISGKPTSAQEEQFERDRKSTRLNSSHSQISYAVFCLKKKNSKPVDPVGAIHTVEGTSASDTEGTRADGDLVISPKAGPQPVMSVVSSPHARAVHACNA